MNDNEPVNVPQDPEIVALAANLARISGYMSEAHRQMAAVALAR